MNEAVDDALQKKSDDVQLQRYDALKNPSIRSYHALERARSVLKLKKEIGGRSEVEFDTREERRAFQRMSRRLGEAEALRVKDLRDPAKQAELAHKRALSASETKLDEANTNLSLIRGKLQVSK